MYKTLTFSVLLAFPFLVAGITSPEVDMFSQERVVREHSVDTEELLQRMEERRQNMENRREEITSYTLEERREFIDSQKEKLIENRDTITEIAENARNMNMERVQTYRINMAEELRNRMNENISRRVDEMGREINMINMRLSSSYMNILSKIEDLIEKMEERMEMVEENSGKDLTLVYEKLLEAREHLLIAREEVALQEGYFYEISADSLNGVGEAFSEAIKMIREDHEYIRKELIGSVQLRVRESQTLLQEALK